MNHLTESVLSELRGGLWHTTPPDRFSEILNRGAILPDPGFSNWRAIGGGDCCSYARKLKGVSLFDFDQFDPDTYEKRCPSCSWYTFVPCCWDRAVWIEIDREKVALDLISASEVARRHEVENAHRHNYMPYIEAIHQGDLPRAAFRRAFLVCKEDDKFHALSV
jgi:hypothetical protein